MKLRQVLRVALFAGVVLLQLSFNATPQRERASASIETIGTRLTPIHGADLLLNISHYAVGIVWGVGDYSVQYLHCLKQLFLHPITSLSDLARVLVDFKGTYRSLKSLIASVLAEYPSYSVSQKARLHAMVCSEALLTLVPISLPFSRLVRINMVSKIKPAIDMTLNKIKRASPVRLPFDPVLAAQWFASEGQG